jgi:Kef-type K+ transport system membrane component KefB
VVLVSNSAKIISSYIFGRKELGTKQSILLGIGLSVRFSTSIVIIKILFDSGLIDVALYSVLIASSIVFKFIIPVMFSNLLVKWGVSKKK